MGSGVFLRGLTQRGNGGFCGGGERNQWPLSFLPLYENTLQLEVSIGLKACFLEALSGTIFVSPDEAFPISLSFFYFIERGGEWSGMGFSRHPTFGRGGNCFSLSLAAVLVGKQDQCPDSVNV